MIGGMPATDSFQPLDCAIVYDFDGTLADGDCAQHGLMPAIGIDDVGGFWQGVKGRTKDEDGDEILAYLGLLAQAARQADKKEELTPERLRHHGASIPLFPGVDGWFDAIKRPGHAVTTRQQPDRVAALSFEHHSDADWHQPSRSGSSTE